MYGFGPTIVAGFLIVLSLAWMLIALFIVQSFMYRVILGTVGLLLVITAIVLLLRSRKIASTKTFMNQS